MNAVAYKRSPDFYNTQAIPTPKETTKKLDIKEEQQSYKTLGNEIIMVVCYF